MLGREKFRIDLRLMKSGGDDASGSRFSDSGEGGLNNISKNRFTKGKLNKNFVVGLIKAIVHSV